MLAMCLQADRDGGLGLGGRRGGGTQLLQQPPWEGAAPGRAGGLQARPHTALCPGGVGGRPCGTGRVPGMSCTGQSPLALWLGARGPEAGQLAAACSRSPAFRSVGLDGAQTRGVKGRLPQGGTRWGLPHAAGTPSRGRRVWVPQGEGSPQSLRTQSPWVRELGRTLFLTAPGCQGWMASPT